jgi:hypothetical protein
LADRDDPGGDHSPAVSDLEQEEPESEVVLQIGQVRIPTGITGPDPELAVQAFVNRILGK